MSQKFNKMSSRLQGESTFTIIIVSTLFVALVLGIVIIISLLKLSFSI